VSRPSWEQRVERAGALAARHGAAAGPLRFYQRVAAAQQDLYREFIAPGRPDDGALIRRSFPCLLEAVESAGTAELRQSAEEVRRSGEERWVAGILDAWHQAETDAGFLVRAFLQPWAEACCPAPAGVSAAGNHCPACGRKPQAATLRPEFDGMRRRLACSLCHWEWDFRRILCPACGETGFDALPAFRAEEYPHLRVDACETCRTYLLTVDASRDPDAVPLVEDLAAIPLHLWAAEQGYRRLQPNLFGL